MDTVADALTASRLLSRLDEPGVERVAQQALRQWNEGPALRTALRAVCVGVLRMQLLGSPGGGSVLGPLLAALRAELHARPRRAGESHSRVLKLAPALQTHVGSFLHQPARIALGCSSRVLFHSTRQHAAQVAVELPTWGAMQEESARRGGVRPQTLTLRSARSFTVRQWQDADDRTLPLQAAFPDGNRGAHLVRMTLPAVVVSAAEDVDAMNELASLETLRVTGCGVPVGEPPIRVRSADAAVRLQHLRLPKLRRLQVDGRHADAWEASLETWWAPPLVALLGDGRVHLHLEDLHHSQAQALARRHARVLGLHVRHTRTSVLRTLRGCVVPEGVFTARRVALGRRSGVCGMLQAAAHLGARRVTLPARQRTGERWFDGCGELRADGGTGVELVLKVGDPLRVWLQDRVETFADLCEQLLWAFPVVQWVAREPWAPATVHQFAADIAAHALVHLLGGTLRVSRLRL